MFDNKKVGNSGELVRIVGDTTVGRTVDVMVLRQGERIKVSVKLGQRPTNKELNTKVIPPEPAGSGGMTFVFSSLFVGRCPSFTLTFMRSPCRSTITSTVLPTVVSPTIRTNSPELPTFLLSNITITSEANRPASLDGHLKRLVYWLQMLSLCLIIKK